MPRDPHLRTSLGSNPLGEHGVRGRFGTGTLEPDGQRGVVRPFKFGCVMTTAVTQPTREDLLFELTSMDELRYSGRWERGCALSGTRPWPPH
jgi:hypothetical protein